MPITRGLLSASGMRTGLAVSTAYQVAYSLPRWQQLVGSHLRRGGTSPAAALAALAAFGAVIVLHTFVQVHAPISRRLQPHDAQWLAQGILISVLI